MTIEERLKSYSKNKARIGYLKLQLEGIMDNIKYGMGIEESDADTIEGMTYHRNIDGQPMGSGVSSKTERVALDYRCEQEKMVNPDGESIMMLRRVVEQEIRYLEREVAMVDAIMSALGEEERYIITRLYIDKMPWEYIIRDYAARYAPREERTLKDKRQIAMRVMEAVTWECTKTA
jgi:hypothetical protein